MQLGMIGLGRMGANMVRRLQKNGHKCVVYDRSSDSVKQLAGEGATGAISLNDVLDFSIDILQIVVGDVAGQVDIANTARRDVNALIAPHVAQHRVVVDQQIEVEAIQAQGDSVRVVDADVEVEIDRRRGERQGDGHVRPDVAQRIARIDDVQTLRERAASRQRERHRRQHNAQPGK